MGSMCQPARTEAIEHGSCGIYDVESLYQAAHVEDREDFVLAVVNCRVCELAIAE
jgi:hypothetical protein